jgi:molybdenum cofactor cytidylyltransferase|tara:strand:- start:3261 stop:3860 length:600 start_codon:yes stop_codon:yes gene_type:complete
MISAIILAAGESRRMKEPKPLMNWGDSNLINYQISVLENPKVEEIIIVLGSRADEISNSISEAKFRVVENKDFKLGKTTSIIKGLNSISNTNNDVLILACDQPRTKDLVGKVIDFHLELPHVKKITMPIYQKKSGHPIIFSNLFFKDLLAIKEATQGIRQIIKENEGSVYKYETSDESATVDLNTPDQYKQSFNNWNNN